MIPNITIVLKKNNFKEIRSFYQKKKIRNVNFKEQNTRLILI